MNFGKLLAAGKNIFGGGKTIVYRQDKHVYLPKFNAEKNPFLPKMANPAPVEAKPVTAPVVARPVPAAKPKASAVPAVPDAVAPQGNWVGKLNPFRAPAPAPAPRPLTQPELLSLDSVKVLHNDLSDADVDVVPVKSRTVRSAPASPAEFLGEQLLRTA